MLKRIILMLVLTNHISYRHGLILTEDEQRNRTRTAPNISPININNTITLASSYPPQTVSLQTLSYTTTASIPPDDNETFPPEYTGNLDEIEQGATASGPPTTNIDNYVPMPTSTPVHTSSQIKNSSFRIVASAANFFTLFITIANIIHYYQVH